MNDTRRAALVLHGLSPDDRQWLLAQLPPVPRRSLDAALDELRALGIPADPALAAAATSAAAAAAAPQAGAASTAPAGGGDPAAWQALWQAEAAAVLQALSGQSPALVACLLALRPWPWASTVRGVWSAALAHPAGDAPPAAPPALAAALVTAVSARLPRYRRATPQPDACEATGRAGLRAPLGRLLLRGRHLVGHLVGHLVQRPARRPGAPEGGRLPGRSQPGASA